MPRGFKKVPLTPAEVLACILAFGAVQQPPKATSHVQYHCMIRGQQVTITFDTGVRLFTPDTRGPLWGIVRKQLCVEWHEFYAADASVARRSGIPYNPPKVA